MHTPPEKKLFLGLLVLIVFTQAPGLGLVLGLVILAAGTMLRSPKTPTTHGSARLGDLDDAKLGGLISGHPESVVLGRATWLGRGASARQLVTIHDFTHLLTVAGTGRGKGVSTVIPNAFRWPKGLIVTDKDFEVFRTVSAYRRRTYGQEQYRIDPLDLLGPGGAGFNPMAEIDGNAITLFEDSCALANLIVFRTGKEHEPYWDDVAEAVIAAFIAFVCACEADPNRRNLVTVRDLLSSPEKYERAVAVMKRVTSHHGILARAAGRMEFVKDRELNSVMSCVNRHIKFLNSPGIAKSFSRSSFKAAELRTPTGASVYLPIVPGRTDVMAPFNRVMVGSLIRAAAAALPFEHNRMLAILDEAGQLGRLPVLQEATTLFRGRGTRLWFIFQSLDQVATVYGDHAQILLDNLDTQQYFGLDAATETAEKISRRIGDATVADGSTNTGSSVSRSEPSFGSQSGGSVSVSHSTGDTRNWIARKVLFPDEIARLDPKISLVFHRHLPVLPIELVRYYEDAEFADCRAESTNQTARPRRRAKGRALPQGVGHFLLGLAVVTAAVGLLMSISALTAPTEAELRQRAMAAARSDIASLSEAIRISRRARASASVVRALEARRASLRAHIAALEEEAAAGDESGAERGSLAVRRDADAPSSESIRSVERMGGNRPKRQAAQFSIPPAWKPQAGDMTRPRSL